MSSGLYQIEKLDETNYDGWSIQMRSVLIHSEIWSYVSGDLPRPDDNAGALLKAWKSKDEKALASIVLSVKTSQLTHIKQSTTSTAAWDRLKEIHRPTGPARKVSLFKQLVNLKMLEGTSMATHLNAFFGLSEKVAEIDINLPDELLTIILLSGLPKSYENFVVAIESRDELPKPQALKSK